MCGIIAVLQTPNASSLREDVVRLSRKIRHRGPDSSGIWIKDQAILAHERLAIIDLENGLQPLTTQDKGVAIVVNGEIYNHDLLRQELSSEYNFQTQSDSEVLLAFWVLDRPMFDRVTGDFAFIITDGKDFLAARDPVGVCPLYWGTDSDGAMWFASEMKALINHCVTLDIFPPGHFYSPEKGLQKYYNPLWLTRIPTGECDFALMREALEKSVVRRMMCDVPYGVLLSGGLDSSLIASIASRHASNRVEEQESSPAWWPRLHTFCIGVEKNSPDQISARRVAKFLNSVHHEFIFSIQEGLDAIESVIWHIESYDVTTIRASTPMVLMSRKIKTHGVKVVLSGEGSDEIFGGYLYFHLAPDSQSFHNENIKRLENLHLSDCLRANKSTAAFGVEVRVPFLDKDFLDAAFSFDPKLKLITKEHKEKWILRKAFDVEDKPYLPKDLLWRQKEQFSDGVGYTWIDELKSSCEKKVPDDLFEKRASIFQKNTPTTKEAFYFRQIFEKLFPHKSAVDTVDIWAPTWSTSADPSGRTQEIHEAAISQPSEQYLKVHT